MGNLPFGTTGKNENWVNQNKQEHIIYDYVNLHKGGTLIDVLNGDDGRREVRRIIREEIKRFMYNNGEGKSLSKLEFIKWKNKSVAQKKGYMYVETRGEKQIIADFKEDQYSQYIPHDICWRLAARGGVGETILHLCMLNDTPVHHEIAKILLSEYPKLSLDIYEELEYYGESALHLAISFGEFEMVRCLIEAGANVNQRATGNFFLPEDQKGNKPASITNYDGYAYYGEYPLSFAACFGHEEIYDYLIDRGADPNLQDSFGNSVLHMLVINDKISMYSYAIRHHAKKANMELKNNQKLTALSLASGLGRNNIFKEIIELQSMKCNNVYQISKHATYSDWSSTLMYLTEGKTDDHLEMLAGGVIRQLLDEKWKTFAKKRFFERLILSALHLFTLSIAIYTRPDGVTDNNGAYTRRIVRYICELIVCCDCITNVVFLLEELRSQGFRNFLTNQITAPAKFVFHISCILILVVIPVRLFGYHDIERIILCIAVPMAWGILLFFARGATLLGPFVCMFYNMCANDLFRFVTIFLIFLLQFSQTFYFMFKDIENSNVLSYKTPGGTMMRLFQMTLGEFKYNDFDSTKYPLITKLIFCLFAILVTILLLNMLIAMMGDTYSRISRQSEKEWRRQWAQIIVVLERSFSCKQLLMFQKEYSVKVVKKGEKDSRGLMVIKLTKKTKAKQKKAAIQNWKTVVYEIKEILKNDFHDGDTDIPTPVIKSLSPRDRIESSSEDEQDFSTRISRKNSKLKRTLTEGNDGFLEAINQMAWHKDIDISPVVEYDDISEIGNNVIEENNDAISNIDNEIESINKCSNEDIDNEISTEKELTIDDKIYPIRDDKIYPESKLTIEEKIYPEREDEISPENEITSEDKITQDKEKKLKEKLARREKRKKLKLEKQLKLQEMEDIKIEHMSMDNLSDCNNESPQNLLKSKSTIIYPYPLIVKLKEERMKSDPNIDKVPSSPTLSLQAKTIQIQPKNEKVSREVVLPERDHRREWRKAHISNSMDNNSPSSSLMPSIEIPLENTNKEELYNSNKNKRGIENCAFEDVQVNVEVKKKKKKKHKRKKSSNPRSGSQTSLINE